MTTSAKSGTSEVNGKLWGARAQDWADIQEQTVRPAFAEVLRKTGIGSDTHYLDVGCGAGMAANMAADSGARIAGIDASSEMLAIAAERTPSGDFRQGDIEHLPWDDDSFDVVTGFNSFQYAANPVQALVEARRVARSDGKIVFLTWGAPAGMEAADVIAAQGALLPPPPPGTPGPFALSDDGKLKELAGQAGIETIEVFDIDCPFQFKDHTTAVRGFQSAGVSEKIRQIVGNAKLEAVLTDVTAPFVQPDGSVRIGAAFKALLGRPA